MSEEAPVAADLAAGAWREAWLTCASRRVAPLARIWQPARQGWAELAQLDLGLRMGALLEEEMVRESEPLRPL